MVSRDDHPGDLGNDIVEAVEVLDIQGRVYVYPFIEYLLDVLVAFRVARPRCIGMGKFIDKYQLGMGGEDCIEIHLRDRHIPVLYHLPGDDREPFNQCFCLSPAMRLNVPDFYINSLILPEVRCLQHLVRLSYPGNVTKENFEFAPVLLPLFTLYMGKKSIGVRAIFWVD